MSDKYKHFGTIIRLMLALYRLKFLDDAEYDTMFHLLDQMNGIMGSINEY